MGQDTYSHLTPGRRGEVCYQLILLRVKKSGLSLNNLKRELGNMASELDGVTVGELRSLAVEMLPKLIGEALGFDSVEITMEHKKKW